jgi:hypothetical protein
MFMAFLVNRASRTEGITIENDLKIGVRPATDNIGLRYSKHLVSLLSWASRPLEE